jgi:hypothetical protein
VRAGLWNTYSEQFPIALQLTVIDDNSYRDIGNDYPQQAVEEDYVYEPVGVKRKAKVPPTPPRRSEL